jgi:hypothetical protein
MRSTGIFFADARPLVDETRNKGDGEMQTFLFERYIWRKARSKPAVSDWVTAFTMA